MLQRDFLRARRSISSSENSNHSNNENHSPTTVPGKKRTFSRLVSTELRLPQPFAKSPVASISMLPPRSPCSSSCGHLSVPFSASPSSPGLPGPGKETVRVAVRCRPATPAECDRDGPVVVAMDPTNQMVTVRGHEAPYYVDVPVWSCNQPALDGSAPLSQADVYEHIGRPLLLHAMDGYNSTLIAYGQTGSGKTYTMLGGGKGYAEATGGPEEGIIPRMCMDLFAELRERTFVASSGEQLSWEVHVRYVEVYCEKVCDLLNVGAPVTVREEVTPESATFALVGARRIKADNTSDLLQAFALGNKFRRTAVTKSNERSSRSHTIFMIELSEQIAFEEPDGTVATATNRRFCIRLVDLAGSERVSETGVQGQQLKEARNINRSLFTLGMVIEHLSDPKRRGIKPPYRDSVLTKILRDTFGGNSKTTLICTLNPCESHRLQTIQSLNYAAKARKVLNKPMVEEDPAAVELRRANEELLRLRQELKEAQRTGAQRESIERQLHEANERLRSEQALMRRRREAMERREADLVARLRDMEHQRAAYEAQMAALESEATLARAQQLEREEQLHEAQRLAEASATQRLAELQEQRVESEVLLKAKEDELLRRQRDVEERMQDLQFKSRTRVEELLRQQKDMEEELREKERLASAQERDLRKKYQVAQEEAAKLEQRTAAMEGEWVAKVQALEQSARAREAEVAARAQEAQERLRTAEEEARRAEAAMQLKWEEAERQANRLQAEADSRQAEVDRRVLELGRRALEKEGELEERLRKADFELRSREREAVRQKEEMETLRQANRLQAESGQSQIEEHRKLMKERDTQLQRREVELDKQFEEILLVKREWEEKHASIETNLQVMQEELLAKVQAKEAALLERERKLRQDQDTANSLARASEMELKRKELDLLAQKSDAEIEMQKSHQVHTRAKEELQRAMDRFEADSRLVEERLQRWETELQARRTEGEQRILDREAAVVKRERTVAISEEALMARKEDLTIALARTQAMETEHQAVLMRLSDREAENDSLRRSLQLQLDEMRSRQITQDGEDQNRYEHTHSAMRSLHHRELVQFISSEAFTRNSITTEEETEVRFLSLSYRLGVRDAKHHQETADYEDKNNALQLLIEQERDEQRRQSSRAIEWVQRCKGLELELDKYQRELTEVKVQLGTVTASARLAEGSLERTRQQLRDVESTHRGELQETRSRLSNMHGNFEVVSQRSAKFSRSAEFLICDFEEMHRNLVEHHMHRESMLMKMLEMAERNTQEKAAACTRLQVLCYDLTEQARGTSSSPTLSELRRPSAHQEAQSEALFSMAAREQEVRNREHRLAVEQEALQRRVSDFECDHRRREERLREEEEHVKRYLLELEAMDLAKMSDYAARENALVAETVRLKEREAVIAGRMHGIYEAVLTESAARQAESQRMSATVRKESQHNIAEIQMDLELCQRAAAGDSTSIEELLRRKEAGLKREAERLAERVRQAAEEDAKRQARLAAEEDQIRQYLIYLEEEDVRNALLSEQGQNTLREAEERLSAAKSKEEDMRDMARRLQLEAMEKEEESKLLETTLRRQERSMRKQIKARKAVLDKKKREADSVAESNERTLLGLEDDLRAIINRNKDAEHTIKTKDEEIKRQELYHVDLSKMLADRERLLRLEHAHRMNGKDSAMCLAGDLLDRNDALHKQVKTLQRKYAVLVWNGKVECEQCSWQNTKDSRRCRCCGNVLQVGHPDSAPVVFPVS